MSTSTSTSRSRAIVRYDTEDTAGTSSNNRSGQSSKRRKHLDSDHDFDDEAIDRMAADCLKYLLLFDHKKTPIKRVDLFKAVIKRSPDRKTCEEVIQRVKNELSNVFGIELAECPETANTYILVNRLPAEVLTETIESETISDNQCLTSGLLTAVLAVISMSDGSLLEDQMWKFLAKLGFDVNSKSQTIHLNDDSNGITIKKLMTELWVRQLYLKYEKIPRSEPLVHEFKWGFRAEKELSQLDVLKFVCEVFGDGSKPEDWPTHYDRASKQCQTTGEDVVEVMDGSDD